MNIYHGTGVYFNKFNLGLSGLYKDFGSGVYLSVDKSHAKSVALWKNYAEVWVYTYNIDKTKLRDFFNVKEFKSTSVEYLKFIVSCRTGKSDTNYDIVIGPTADANAQFLINDFIANFSNPTKQDYINLKKKLNFGLYPTQFCFKTQKAINYLDLRRTSEERLK